MKVTTDIRNFRVTAKRIQIRCRISKSVERKRELLKGFITSAEGKEYKKQTKTSTFIENVN